MGLELSGITKSYGTEMILDHISFGIRDGQKVALTGINGCGKTTLLRIIASEISADEGSIMIPSSFSIGYLAQDHEIGTDQGLYDYIKEAKATVFEMEERLRSLEQRMKNCSGEELESLMNSYSILSHDYERSDGFAAESMIKGVIAGLGFAKEDYGRKVSSMSGGEKTRAALARLLMDDHDLLMLDEPTNHLDLKAVEWLETFLISCRKAVLVVSHDRYFLDRVVTKVVELENRKALVYEGNYTVFSRKKEQLRREQKKAWLNQQAQIRHQEAVIEKLRSFNREKSIKRAESREKALAKIERLEKPVSLNADMRLEFKPALLSGNDVLTVKGLSKSYGGVTLFSDLDFEIKRGEKVALIGANGTGKSTIMRILNGLVSGDEGSCALGSNVIPGYYDQEQHILDPENTVFEEIAYVYPSMTNTDIRNVCAGFLFTGDDVFKEIRLLSGGEKARLSLAKLMLAGSNFLLLDEPTNHLDIISREILEEAIRGYEGTVFYVSHDRYFINRTADWILELENARLTQYKGNYDYYLQKKSEASSEAVPESTVSSSGSSEAKTDWQEYKKAKAREQKRLSDLEKTESSIDSMETRIRQIDEELTDPAIATDPAALNSLCTEKAGLEAELEDLYLRWEELSVETD